jgi:hypothetical protein
MRRSRKGWQEIADHLEKQHGLKVTHRTLFRFFARATDPKRKRPLGFEDPPVAPELSTDQTTATRAPVPSASQKAREQARRIRQDFQQKSSEPFIKPYRPA